MPTSGTLTKAHIIDAVIEQNGYTRKKSIETVEILLELIKQSLASDEDVLISGFGKFCVKQKAKRRGRNPATSEDMMLECSYHCHGDVSGCR
jgi:integration host factor subunit alpha